MYLYRPVPRNDGFRPDDAQPLAGSAHVWWHAAEALQGGGGVLPVAALDADTRARLSTPREAIAGLELSRPRIMGVLNVTPDSFSDGGAFFDHKTAVARARAMVEAGADILDIGGESTRPGAEEVPVATEIERTRPVIAALREAGMTVPISIDTRKAAVASAALEAGADMVNDVAALTWDSEMAPLVAEAGVPLCLMHAQGTPQTMQLAPQYDNVVTDVALWLRERVEAALAAGVAQSRIMVDPGIGFGKTLLHNLDLLRNLSVLHDTGCALLLGASRKRFIGTISGAEPAAARVHGSVAVALQAAAQGAHVIRVHDVAETVQALSLWRALAMRNGEQP